MTKSSCAFQTKTTVPVPVNAKRKRFSFLALLTEVGKIPDIASYQYNFIPVDKLCLYLCIRAQTASQEVTEFSLFGWIILRGKKTALESTGTTLQLTKRTKALVLKKQQQQKNRTPVGQKTSSKYPFITITKGIFR
jgi:hypothetical protein